MYIMRIKRRSQISRLAYSRCMVLVRAEPFLASLAQSTRGGFISNIRIPEQEMTFTAIRAQGVGGQNVNKVSSAIHLRFSIPDSTLPEAIKARLMALNDKRITTEGVVVIKAQANRSQEQNRMDAIARLQSLVDSVASVPKKRKPTRPTLGSQRRRLEGKAVRGQVKRLRGKVAKD